MGSPTQQSDDATIRHKDNGDLAANHPPAPGTAPGTAPGSAPDTERVIYRDVDEFNKALDAAADSIAKTKGPDLLGHIVWWGTILFTGFLYGSKRIFNWDLRHTLIPGIDLMDPLMVLIIGMVIWFLAWHRNQHGRILRDRLCFQCGTSLRGIEVDTAGDGVCPTCEHAYNLGEYRRPGENRGQHFHGYLDETHFEKALFVAAEQIKKTRSTGFEVDFMGCCWIALGVSFFGGLIFGWELYDWIPGPPPMNLIGFILLLVWGSWYTSRMKKLGPSIIEKRCCLNCGYCLLHTPTDESGLGRCPECGGEFVLGQYKRPPPPESETPPESESPSESESTPTRT